jgi:putative transposase
VDSHANLNWSWHLNEVFVRINGETHYLPGMINHKSQALEMANAKRQDRKTALEFLKHAMKRCGRLHSIVTNHLTTYGAAMKVIGN